jgi:hypothetical protein
MISRDTDRITVAVAVRVLFPQHTVVAATKRSSA